MFEIAAGVCLGILGAWFLLQIGVAEAVLALMVVAVAIAAIYWLWTGDGVTPVVKATGIIALLIIILGSIRLELEKWSDRLAGRWPPPFGTKGKPTKDESSERHPPAVPR